MLDTVLTFNSLTNQLQFKLHHMVFISELRCFDFVLMYV